MNEFLAAALHYAELGMSVIPVVKGEKKPRIEWKAYQKKKATKEEITEWWTKWPEDNVGIVTGSISNLSVVDLDRYKENFDESIELEHFPETFTTPTSISPRKGNHLYLQYDPTLPGKADILPGIDIRSEGNFIVAPPSQNGNGRPYEWIKGLELGQVALAAAPHSLLQFFKNKHNSIYNNNVYISNKRANVKDDDNTGQQRQQVTTLITNDSRFFTEGRRNEDMFTLAYALAKAGCNTDYIAESLRNAAETCKPPYSEKETLIVINSAMDRAKNKTRNLTAEIREWILIANGSFLIADVSKELDLITRDSKMQAAVILSRFVKAGLIERVGTRRGSYRLVDPESPIIQVTNADRSPYPIEFPLGVEQYVLIHKSNIVILAGESNSGKTGFCLATCQLNRGKYPINYLSSEMADGTELGIRTDQFGPVSWEGISFRYRSDNFPDVIRPDDLNIVDYLEEVEEPWKMIQRIKDIGKKLVNGIAIICIQKNSKKQFGFGGEGTKNAARLYMTITGMNRLTIEKGKIWASQVLNPNGSYCDFKLAAGCKFTKTGGGWHHYNE